MYNPDALHYQIVWPVPAPPVQTMYWDDNSWLSYCWRFRPDDYQGGEFDKAAWQNYLRVKELLNLKERWPRFDVEFMRVDDNGQNLYKFTPKIKEG